jgi:superfamily II DNA/RNA helicase
VIVVAQSGSGKTLAYAIGVLQGIISETKCKNTTYCLALIIAQTQKESELIASAVQPLSQHLNIKVGVCSGKEDIK